MIAGANAGNVAADESGQDRAEHAILIGLIAIAAIGAVATFGGSLTGLHDSIRATPPFGSAGK